MRATMKVEDRAGTSRPRPRRAIGAGSAVLLCLAVPGWPQHGAAEPPTGDQDRTAPGFREEIEVRLVQVPILARDNNGDPVIDLRPNEIVVKDRGQRRQAAFLEPFVVPPAAAQPLPDVVLHVDLPGAAERASASRGVESRKLILLIDVENDQPLGKERAARDLERYVEHGLDQSYRVAVLAFDGDLEVELPFTRDRTVVAAAIRRVFDRPPASRSRRQPSCARRWRRSSATPRRSGWPRCSRCRARARASSWKTCSTSPSAAR